MLRITSSTKHDETCLVLEGKLIGLWVDELARVAASAKDSGAASRVRVDLSGVTFVDANGQELLRSMAAQGMRLFAEGVMNRFFVNDILRCAREK